MCTEKSGMKSSNDRELLDLITAYRSGSEEAFEEIVRRFDAMIRKIALERSMDVREVYSDACLSLRRALDTYDGRDEVTFGLYAKICVTRAILDLLKRQQPERDVPDFNVDDVAVSDGVQRRLEREEAIASFVSSARRLLSDLEFEVFSLSMQGYKVSEIADKLNKGTKSIENAKARMLKSLRSGLGEIPEF